MSPRRATASRLEVVPLGGRLGARVQIDGDPQDVSTGDVENLKDALLDHKVLVLNGLPADDGGRPRLLARLGAVTPGTDREPARTLDSDARHRRGNASWVTPGSHRLAPPRIVCLWPASPDAVGECSRFADVVGAYCDLPSPLRALADRSWAQHSSDAGCSGPKDGGGPELVAHPVTRLHTETGDRGLLIGGYARQVLGLSEQESATVLHLLQSYLVRPHNLFHWVWQADDLLIIDACAVQIRLRAGVAPPAPSIACLEIAGDVPLGVDGRHSHLVSACARRVRRSA